MIQKAKDSICYIAFYLWNFESHKHISLIYTINIHVNIYVDLCICRPMSLIVEILKT